MKSKLKKESNPHLENLENFISNNIPNYNKNKTFKKTRNSIYIKSSPIKNKDRNSTDFITSIINKKTEENKFIISLARELNQLEESFKKQFFKEIKDKKEDEIKAIIPQKKLDYENRVKLIINKCEKELMYYKDQQKKIEKTNLDLKRNIEMMKKQKKRLYQDLKEAELSIEKINKKYELYIELKPYYEILDFEFNIKEDKSNINNKAEENKYNIEKHFTNTENYVADLEKKFKEESEKIREFKNQTIKEEMNNKNSNQKLYNYFIDLEKSGKMKEEEYKNEISKIKEEIHFDKKSQIENEKILNIFISIYNLLYKKLNLQRDLILNPKNIPLLKTDYIPQTYITEEMINYINLMLQNSTEESCGLLLREIVSYANMMLREYDSEFNKKKYDPVKTIEEIETYIKIIKEKNKALNDEVEKIKKENENESDNINNMNKKLKQINIMYEKLHQILKIVYINSNEKDKKKIIKKSLSENDFNENGVKEEKKDEINNDKRFIYLRKYLEGKKNKNIVFEKGMDNFMSHANRLFFYKSKIDIRPKHFGVYVNAHKRIKNKFLRLKKLQENRNKYTNVENAINSNINEKIDKLVFKINTIQK